MDSFVLYQSQKIITDRKRVEADLREKEQFLRSVYDGSQEGIFVVEVLEDGDFRFVGLNPAHERLTGISTAELCGKTPEQVLSPEDAAAARQNYRNCVEAGTSIIYEERMPFLGIDYWWLTHLTPIRDKHSQIDRIIGISTNITALKRTEAALHQKAQQEQSFNRVIQAIHHSLNLRTIFSTATAEISQLLGVEQTKIMQYLPDRCCWVRLAAYVQGMETQNNIDLGFEIPDQGNPFAERLKQFQVVRVEQPKDVADPINREIAKTIPLPWLLVPIVVNQSIWGNLSLHRSQPGLRWQDDEVELVCRIAEQLAIAIYQADLYQQAQIEVAERQRAESALQQMNLDLDRIVHDRTQALEASQEILRQREHQFRTLVENIPDMIIRFDREFRYRYGSPSLATITGAPVSGFIDKTIAEMGYPETLVTLWQGTMQRVLDTRQKETIEFSMELSEGIQHFQAWNVPELDQDGNLESILVVIRDITSLKQTEEALRRSEELLRIALDSAQMGAWHVNLLTGEEIWSDRSQEIFGIVLGTFDGTTETFLSRIHPDDRNRVEQNARQALRTGNREIEYRVVLDDQKVHWIASRGKVFFDEAGNPIQMSGVDMDISDRKQSEQALRESEEKFRQLAETIDSAFWMRDIQQHLIYISPRYEMIWGRSVQSLYDQPHSWLDSVHPEDVSFVLEADQKHYESHEYDVHYRIIRPDGEIRWIHDRAFPIRNEQGEIYRFAGIAEDITEQRRTEAALRQSEARFQRLAANIPGIIYQYVLHSDGSLKFTYVSSSCQQIFELSPEQLQQDMGMLLAMMPANDVEAFHQSRIQSAQTFQPCVLEFQITTPTGRTKWLQAISQPERQSNGEIVWDGLALDVTERKQVEAEILRTRDLFEAVFNRSADAIFLVDEPQRLIRNCNQRAVEMFEATCKEDLLGILGSTLHKTPVTASGLNAFRERFARGGYLQQEIEYHTLKGNSFWGNLAANTIQVGNESMILVRITDINEVKHREAERRQAAEALQTSLQEKEVLLKEIHHRVKNNLQIISSLLRMQSRQIADQQMVALFQEAQNRVQSMALIHEHLYQSPNLSYISFGQYLRTLVNNLFRSYGVREQQITIKLDVEDLQLTLNTAIPCGLIINELVSNALKYAFPGEQLGVVQVYLCQEASATENWVVLTIEDNGVGIPDRVNWETTESLGLRIVRNLITQLGGTLTLDRREGTCFHITFPNPLPLKPPD
ncbi:PAS domain S-box protein [Kovacikia minuta CCNUW1]|uniref:PAS domain S-box protein n=1 Tax=Kovacikia minuta TaxID=2931930 RepID=UPI001CCAF007|nr:PAS domain S-box protein [Kovacikia minuta]UBF24482.1 PAS domain S-box protein [Kovacikia minuta CCNUW1]